jgi:hypothetical protein
MDDKREQG